MSVATRAGQRQGETIHRYSSSHLIQFKARREAWVINTMWKLLSFWKLQESPLSEPGSWQEREQTDTAVDHLSSSLLWKN